MNIPNTNKRTAVMRRAPVVLFAAILCCVCSSTIQAQENDRDHHDRRGDAQQHREGNRNGRQDSDQRGRRGNDRDDRRSWNAHRYPYVRYETPVYVPPPVYYEPSRSPGINFFFPLDFRR